MTTAPSHKTLKTDGTPPRKYCQTWSPIDPASLKFTRNEEKDTQATLVIGIILDFQSKLLSTRNYHAWIVLCIARLAPGNSLKAYQDILEKILENRICRSPNVCPIPTLRVHKSFYPGYKLSWSSNMRDERTIKITFPFLNIEQNSTPCELLGESVARFLRY